jgi:NAD(P)-dependent dehydrogenase (short-subunit alcohol dehydrogenase family)
MAFPSPTKKWHTDTYAAISPSNPALSVKGKKVVMTGGGYGIGREDVLAFAEAGAAEIAILGRKEGPLYETKQLVEQKFPGTKVAVFVADITDPAPVKAAAEKFGTWDILILNAAYMEKKAPVTTIDLGDWWTTFEVCPPSP